MEPYVLIPFGRYTSVIEGGPFHLLRRLKWTVTLNVLSLEAGGSVTVALEGSPDAQSDDTYTTLHSFGAVSATGETVVRSFGLGSSPADFSVGSDVSFMRAHVSAYTGAFVIEMTAKARFVDLEDESHVDELPSVLAESTGTRDRFVDQAESQIMRDLIVDDGGTLAVRSWDIRVADILRQAIIQQAVRRQRAEALVNSGEEAERKEGQAMLSGFDPGVQELLDTLRVDGHNVWRGR